MNDRNETGFLPFLLKCYTLDPAYDEPRLVPDWPHVRKLAIALEKHDRLLVVKSRQMLATWIGTAFILYRALTDGPGIHLVLSKEERSANELIERVRFLYEHVDDQFREHEANSLRGSFGFPALGSRILSLPAAPYAVRGLSPRTVFWDEMAFTPNSDEIWASVKPAVDAGGRFFGVSTPNGPAGTFARLVHGNEKGFITVRIHYRTNPERRSKWRAKARAGLSEARWRREQELSFEGAEGRVYDQFDPLVHIMKRTFKPDPNGETMLYRGIDFGYRRPAVVWVQQESDGSLVVFDCLLGDRCSLDQLVQEIERIDRFHGLDERDFALTGVDPAGAAMTDFGLSPVEGLQARGFRLKWRPSSISAGVEAVRALLRDANGNVRLNVHPRCETLIEAFHGYCWGPDGELPEKDGFYDHPMDALRYLVVNLPTSCPASLIPPPKVAGLPPPPRRNMMYR